MNQTILDYLTKLEKQKRAEGEQFRARAYRNAIKAIRAYPSKIESGVEARKLPGVGEKIAKKIDEILTTGQLQVVDHRSDDELEKQRVLEVFEKVWGAGPKAALEWYKRGYRTLDDVRADPTLTKQRRVGLEYYDDLQERMPRSEADRIVKKILSATKKLGLRIMACGSYRRQEETCGDLDILLSHDSEPVSESHLATFVYTLHRVGLLVADLAFGKQTYMGICKVAAKGRRIDIKIIPRHSWAAATLYFTGSQALNIVMRQTALDKGWILNEKGLFAGREGAEKQIRIQCSTEEEIFDRLGMPYIQPELR